jgi:hypothetical protein
MESCARWSSSAIALTPSKPPGSRSSASDEERKRRCNVARTPGPAWLRARPNIAAYARSGRGAKVSATPSSPSQCRTRSSRPACRRIICLAQSL